MFTKGENLEHTDMIGIEVKMDFLAMMQIYIFLLIYDCFSCTIHKDFVRF